MAQDGSENDRPSGVAPLEVPPGSSAARSSDRGLRSKGHRDDPGHSSPGSEGVTFLPDTCATA